MTQLEHQKPIYHETIRALRSIPRGKLLVKENQLREFETSSGILVKRLEPNEEICGKVLLNNSPLDEVKPGDTVWFRRDCGEPFPAPLKGYILLRYRLVDMVDPTGDTFVESLTEVEPV